MVSVDVSNTGLELNQSELRSCVKDEVDVLSSPSLSLIVSVEVM